MPCDTKWFVVCIVAYVCARFTQFTCTTFFSFQFVQYTKIRDYAINCCNSLEKERATKNTLTNKNVLRFFFFIFLLKFPTLSKCVSNRSTKIRFSFDQYEYNKIGCCQCCEQISLRVSVNNWHINVYVDRCEPLFSGCLVSRADSTRINSICYLLSDLQLQLRSIENHSNVKSHEVISVLCLDGDWHNEMQPTLEWHNESLFWLRCVNLFGLSFLDSLNCCELLVTS